MVSPKSHGDAPPANCAIFGPAGRIPGQKFHPRHAFPVRNWQSAGSDPFTESSLLREGSDLQAFRFLVQSRHEIVPTSGAVFPSETATVGSDRRQWLVGTG